MVCQAASRTRFRALKYENGIAGKPTIIVRVIACFKPMEDCQHKPSPVTVNCFVWMVKAHESWIYPKHSALQLADLNCMSRSLDPRQPVYLPSSINPDNYMFSANVPVPGFAAPGLEKLKTEQTNGAHELLQILPSHFRTLVPNAYPYLNEKQPAVLGGLIREATPNMKLWSFHKRLLVFDQSGNQTRLIYNSICPSVWNPTAILSKQVSDHHFLEEQQIKTDQFTSVKPVFLEESDENHISGKEFEMHEDTEEINALLYSDEDDDCSEDDEVKSTDHSPVAIEENYEKYELIAETTEEVVSSDGPNKRQKFLNGGYNKSLHTDTACSVQLEGSRECENDAESSRTSGETGRKEVGSILGNRRSIKEKIHNTLRILQCLIPGANGKDPMSVLDEAIDYLQYLKLKAVALGL